MADLEENYELFGAQMAILACRDIMDYERHKNKEITRRSQEIYKEGLHKNYSSAKQFLKSDWCKYLTGLDGQVILNKMAESGKIGVN